MINCYSMTTIWEFGHKVENLRVGDKAQRECQWRHVCLRDTPRYERQWHHSWLRGSHDAHTCNHIHWASCAFSQVGCCDFIFTHMHLGSSLSLSCHVHGHPRVCGLFTLVLPFYFLLHLRPLYLFLNYMKFVVNLHNSCNEGVDASDDLLLFTHTAHMNLNTWIDARVIPFAHSPVVRFCSSWFAHHIVAQAQVVCVCHVHTCSERFSPTLSLHSIQLLLLIHLQSPALPLALLPQLRAAVTLRTSLERRWTLLTTPTSSQDMHILFFHESDQLYQFLGRQRFPDVRLKIHLRFNVVRILWALLVKIHGRLWTFATQITEVFVLFARWWTASHNPRFVKIHIRHSGTFNDGSSTGGWFWIHSRSFSLMITVNHFVNDCPIFFFHCLPLFLLHRSSLEDSCTGPSTGLDNFHIWDCSCENSTGCARFYVHTSDCSCNILRDVLVLQDVADVHQCNKVDFPYLMFLCAFFMTSFHSFSIVAFSSGINIAWCDRSFVCASRFPEACVSQRQLFRLFWNRRNSRFFEVHWSEPDSEFVLLSSQVHTWECLVLLGFLRFTRRILSHRYAVSRDETTCACFHLRTELSEELSWGLFIGTNSCVEYQYNWIFFVPQIFGFSPILLPHRIFLLQGVSFLF